MLATLEKILNTLGESSLDRDTKASLVKGCKELELELMQLISEFDSTKEALDKSSENLRLAETQLIQAEKMASLGQLTAGIAHEIQNPLNFVNNFAELNSELAQELLEELAAENYEELKEMILGIQQNSEKINLHGKRAASIVKSMLQYSRSNTSQPELTDINILCDEYMRLAFHGMRARDKSFNVTIESSYDQSLEPIMIVPQDIGRVVLNLITNAFHAVSERRNVMQSNFIPKVSIITKRFRDHIEIQLVDNGSGIQESLLQRIFQPFFTTKPAGQGTGLGLSLSYDIVKSYGGDIKVESHENIGTSFTITLPQKTKDNT